MCIVYTKGRPPIIYTIAGIRCTPPRSSPMNGQVTCSDQNFLGSKCTYICNDGYNLNPIESKETNCVDDGNGDAKGEWDQPTPVCLRKWILVLFSCWCCIVIRFETFTAGECLPVMTSPVNGRVSCSDGNAVRSVCRFTCDEGYYMKSVGGLEYEVSCFNVFSRKMSQIRLELDYTGII